MGGFANDFMQANGQSVALAAAQTDNLAVTSSIILVTPQADNDTITGALPPVQAAGFLYVVNVHPTRNLVLPYNSGSSTAGFRWLNILAHDLTIGPGETAVYAFVPGLGWQFMKPAILT